MQSIIYKLLFRIFTLQYTRWSFFYPSPIYKLNIVVSGEINTGVSFEIDRYALLFYYELKLNSPKIIHPVKWRIRYYKSGKFLNKTNDLHKYKMNTNSLVWAKKKFKKNVTFFEYHLLNVINYDVHRRNYVANIKVPEIILCSQAHRCYTPHR